MQSKVIYITANHVYKAEPERVVMFSTFSVVSLPVDNFYLLPCFELVIELRLNILSLRLSSVTPTRQRLGSAPCRHADYQKSNLCHIDDPGTHDRYYQHSWERRRSCAACCGCVSPNSTP